MKREEYLSQLLGVYRLVSVLSDKNGCRVLRVRHKEHNRDIVVRSYEKPIPAYERLYGIKSENLPLVLDVIALDDGQIVLEEFIDGLCVSDVLETGLYRYRGAKKVITDVCSALYILHKNNIIHRDIKPENIMIDKNGRVVLLDFNASRVIKNSGHDTVIMGTVGFASPEQLGIAQSDARTDIYALGVLLNVMLTGKHPSDTLCRGRAGRIVRTCTQINPNDRYSSVLELAEKL